MCGLSNMDDNAHDRLNFRCPLCGDSHKSEKKKRGWIIFDKDYSDGKYKCFNCNVGMSFTNFIKVHYPHLFDGFRKDILESAFTNVNFLKDDYVKKPKPKPSAISFTKTPPLLKLLSTVKENFNAYSYLQKRKIPESFINELYYCNNYVDFLEENNLYKSTFMPKEDRCIIIPLFQNGQLVFIQGRSIEDDPFLRYRTITVKEGFQKIWGLDRFDRFKTGYIFEGVLDACFIKNSLSNCGGSFSPSEILSISKNIVYCPDGDIWDNPDVQKASQKYINAGGKVFIMPRIDYKVGKDINKLIENDYTMERVQKMIEDNVYEGASATARLKIMKVI